VVGTSLQVATTALAQPPQILSAEASPDAGAQPTRLAPIGTFKHERRSQQLVFSPTGARVAHVHGGGVELWQTQPIKRLFSIAETSGLGIRQVFFSPDGLLHYVDGRKHAWITADLQHGTGGKADLISPNGRYAVRTGLREGDEGFAPQFYNATSDVYDLKEKRSVCQFPAIGGLANAAFTSHWFAAQLAATGPQPPKPLAVCEIDAGQALIMPFGDARSISPTLDPNGRWMLVQMGGTRLLGMSQWQESKLFALPLARSAFAKASDNDPYPCAELPCGMPAPLPIAVLPGAKPVVSPDGNWLVDWGNGHSIKLFKSPDMEQVATLAHAPFEKTANRSTGGRRVVFSADSRWMGMQAGTHLYRLDLHSNPLRLQELTPPASDFDLQGIASDGQHWLVLHQPAPGQPLQGALWRTQP